MVNKDTKRVDFYAGGFLYNPKTQSVLLHLRDNKTTIHPNEWGFFGGKNEGVESPKACFARELNEELGIKINEGEIKDLCNYFNKDRGTRRHVFYVESGLDKSRMTLSEGANFDWIPLNNVFEYDLTKKTRQDLKMFVSRGNK